MSDYHEMWDEFRNSPYGEYDPEYFNEKDDKEDNRPVNPDDWAKNHNELEGEI